MTDGPVFSIMGFLREKYEQIRGIRLSLGKTLWLRLDAQPLLAYFVTSVVKDRQNLKPSMEITAYNQHRSLRPRVQFCFAANHRTLASGANVVMRSSEAARSAAEWRNLVFCNGNTRWLDSGAKGSSTRR